MNAYVSQRQYAMSALGKYSQNQDTGGIRALSDAGYQRIKIKIKPGWDVDAVQRIRDACGPIPLMVDANAAYTLADAAHLGRLDAFDLMMIEQPLDYDDIADHAALQRQIATPICLDESITSARLAIQALETGACRIINIKPGRLGGFAESIRVHDACAASGVPMLPATSTGPAAPRR